MMPQPPLSKRKRTEPFKLRYHEEEGKREVRARALNNKSELHAEEKRVPRRMA